MSHIMRRLSVSALLMAVVVAIVPTAVWAAKAEVRWNEFRGTEVGEKHMNELKAAFEKDNPDITLTIVDSPFTGFHDRALTLFQAQKLADVMMIQVD